MSAETPAHGEVPRPELGNGKGGGPGWAGAARDRRTEVLERHMHRGAERLSSGESPEADRCGTQEDRGADGRLDVDPASTARDRAETSRAGDRAIRVVDQGRLDFIR